MKQRLVNIDLLRILCCFSVVFIHVAAVVWYDYEMKSFDWQVSTFYDTLVRFCVPVFYMISGMLFLSRKNIDMKKIYKKNILKILIILAIWLPIHAIISHYRYGNDITSLTGLIDVFRTILKNQYQFWFLFPLISMYILLPILKKITEDKKTCKYYLMLFLVFQITRQTVSPFLGEGVEMGVYNLFTPDMVLGYYGYFILGYYLYQNDLNKKQKKLSYALGVFSIIVATGGTIIYSYKKQILFDSFFGYFNMATFLASIAVFNFFKYELKNIKFNIRKERLINTVAECTMGVYIFHNLVKWGLECVEIDTYFAPAIISIPILSILIFLLSVTITLVVKKIPIVGKYIV